MNTFLRFLLLVLIVFAGGVALLALIGLTGVETASAQTSGLFSLLEGEPPPNIGVDTLDSRLVRIDFGQLTEVTKSPVGPKDPVTGKPTTPQTLVLNLFDDVVFTGIVEHVEPTSSGYALWGGLEGVELGTMTMVVNGSVVAGTVRTPNAVYSIRTVGDGRYAIRWIDESTLPPLGEPLVDSVSPKDPRPQSTDVPPDDGSVIDVLVVYTPLAKSHEGGRAAIEALIDLFVAETNQAYDNSRVTHRVRLVHREEVDYTEYIEEADPGIEIDDLLSAIDLFRLRRDSDGYMDHVHELRDLYGADLIHLITGNGDTGGVAYSDEVGDDSHGFAVTLSYTSSLVFAHELGHNMGLRHDRYQALRERGTDSIEGFNYGYVNQEMFVEGAPESAYWRTIMSYSTQCSDVKKRWCEWLPYFSNPELDYLGDSMGVPADHSSTGADGPADAVRAMNETRHIVANYRRSTTSADHPRVGLTLSPYWLAENGGVSTVRATLHRPSSADTVVTVSASPAGAVSLSANRTLTIPAGGTTSVGIVTVTGVDNGDQTGDVNVTISATAENATVDVIAPDSVVLAVADDDTTPAVTLSLSSNEIIEGESWRFAAFVTAALDNRSSAETTVATSASPAEFVDVELFEDRPVLVIPAGQTTSSGRRVLIATVDDDVLTGAEKIVTVSGTATNSQGVTGPESVTLTILDDERPIFRDDSVSYTFTAGVTGSRSLPEAAHGNGPLTYSISPAPGNGVTFIPSPPARIGVSATSVAADETSYTLTATDAEGDTDTMTINVTIRSPVCPDSAAVSGAAAGGVVDDCEALLAARDTLAGTASLNWSADRPITEWDGVTTSDGRITEVRLTENELTGVVPSELGSLSNLRSLSLGGNQLTGTIPVELSNLANLRGLSLWDNDLSGAIPTQLGSLTNLRSLSLHGNRLTGTIPAELGKLTNLQWLELGSNQLTGPIPPELGSLASLRGLSLGVNQLSGAVPASLGALTNLERLNLGTNQLSGQIPSSLGGLTNLQELYLDRNRLSGALPHSLTGLTALRALHFYNNPGLCAPTDDAFQAWLRSVDDVRGSNCAPADSPDRAALVALYNATDGPNWTQNHNWLSDAPIEEWHGVTTNDDGRVTDLHLYENKLNGALPPELGSLASLERLNLGVNQLNGQIPPELGSFANLQWLNLGTNQLSGQIPSSLGDLTNLQELYLDRNQLTGTMPSELGSLSNLQRLFLGGNQLTGCIPPGLRSVADDNPDNDPDHDLAELGLPLFCDLLLSGLNVSPRSLTPAFDPNHADYEAFDGPSLVTVKATTEHDATIVIGIRDENGGEGFVPDADDSLAGFQVNLDHQVNREFDVVAIFVLVISQDRVASIYTIRVRPVSPCVASGAVSDMTNTGLISDCETLLAARDTLAGTATLNWSADKPIAEWDGVVLDGTPRRVTRLHLGYRELTGTIPPELGSLANLEILLLYVNQLTGPISPELGSLSNLALLDLRDNRLTGTVPPKLGSLSNLQALRIADNRLTGTLPQSLTMLTALESLQFHNNPGLCASVDDAFQAWLRSIENMFGSSCAPADSAEDRAALVAFYNATEGTNWENNTNWLSNRPIRDWHGVVSDASGRVTWLRLIRNQLTGSIPSELGSLSNLESLFLSANQLTGSIPSELGSLSNLEYLVLSANQLTGSIPSELGSLSNLESLFLSANQLTGSIPSELGNLSNLRRLGLSGNQLTGCVPNGLRDVERNDFDELGLPFCPSPDRAALVALYNATDGPNWTNNTNWLTDAPIGEWHGVTTNDGGRVVELSLSRNQLTGPIPSQLGSLAYLQELNLGFNQLSGIVPPELGGLANLRSLALAYNHLTGEIPPELGNLANLEVLVIQNNQLTGEIPPELGDLSNLEELRFHNNRLSGSVPAALGSLTNLTTLFFHDNRLTGVLPESLTGLTALQALSFHNNPGLCASIDDAFQSWLRSIIREVLGSSCAPADSAEDRAALVALYNATDGANWTNSANWLSDRPIRDWHGVVSDADGRVTELFIFSNGLRGPIPSELGGLANLEILNLRTNRLTGTIPTELGNLANLRQMLLTRNQLSGPIPSQLGNLANLEYLSLHGNQLNGDIPRELGNLANLRRLYLTGNQLSGPIPSQLGNLSNLELLALADNRLTGEIPRELGNLANLRWLYLADNQLTGCVPASLRNVQSNDFDELGLPFCDANECVAGGAVSDATNTGLISECEALLAARDTLAGTATLNWSADTPISEWEGVGLSGTPQRVTRLALPNRGLDGTISSELGRLSMLTHLNLRSNELTGEIPDQLGSLSNLRVLNLHSNSHTGDIPDLSRITGLEALYLPNNADIDADGNKIPGTGLTGEIPTWLNGMTKLRELWLWGNSLSGSVPDLSGMKSLDKLKLANNDLTGGIPEASTLPPNMTWLIIDRNPFGGTIPDMSALSRLRLLWLHSSELTGNIPAGDMLPASLDDLNLRDNMLMGEIPDLSNLDNLTRLRLHNNSLSGEVPATLGDLDSLKYLWLHNEDATKTDKGNNAFTSIASGVGDLADTLIVIALSGNPWDANACVPAELANVAKNDFAEAGIETCGKVATTIEAGQSAILTHVSGVEIDVPVGATMEAATVSIVETDPPESVLDVGRVFDISVTNASGEDVELQQPVTVRMPYSLSEGKDAADVAVLHYDEQLRRWELVDGAVVDETSQSVTVEVTDLSDFTTDEYDNPLEHIAKSALSALGAGLETQYDAGFKHLVSFNLQEGFRPPVFPVFRLGKVGGSLIFDVDDLVSFLSVTLDDLPAITGEGEDGYITFWLNVNADLSTEVTVAPPFSIGFSIPHTGRLNTHNRDPRFDASLSAMTVSLPGAELGVLNVNANGNISPIDAQVSVSTNSSLEAGISFASVSFNLIKGELNTKTLLDALKELLNGGCSSADNSSGTVSQDSFVSQLMSCIIEKGVNSFKTIINNSIAPFTEYEHMSPAEAVELDAAQFNLITAVSGGLDITGDGKRDLVFPSHDERGRPLSDIPLTVWTTGDLNEARDFFVELQNQEELQELGWTISSEVPRMGRDYQHEFTGEALSINVPEWLVTTTGEATNCITAEFKLVHDRELRTDVDLDEKEFELCKSRDLSDLSIEATASPSTITAGEKLTYTVTITNSGPDTATGVALPMRGLLETGLVLNDASHNCPYDAITLEVTTCNLGRLEAGKSIEVTLKVSLLQKDSDIRDIRMAFAVTSHTEDPDFNNNSAQVTTRVTNESQRRALVALYNATDGANWTDNTNWLSDRPIGEWHGVVTDDDGRITELRFQGNRLNGSIPEELGDLPNLQVLNLAVNRLTGQIPEELGGLSNLQLLGLTANRLTGQIPEELGDLSSLQLLYLGDNQLSGSIPKELGNVSNLRSLELYDNRLSGSIPAELSNLSNLEKLYLAGNQLTGCIPRELQDVRDNDFAELGLRFCEEDIPSSDRAALVALYNATDGANWTNNDKWLTDTPIGEWHGVTTDDDGRITELRFQGNRLNGLIPSELGDLSNLQVLNLAVNRLTGQIPEELGGLSNLQLLGLTANLLSGSIPEELGDLSSLQLLYLGDNQLSGSIPKELGNVSNLRSLQLHDNRLSGSIPAELSNLSNLSRLWLSGNQLTGCVPNGLRDVEHNDFDDLGLPFCEEDSSSDRAALVALYNATDGANWTNNDKWLTDAPIGEWHGVTTDANGRVDELWLPDNELTGTIPPELGSLTNLREFRLHTNQLSGEIPEELHNLANLEALSLSHNQLAGEIPEELDNLAHLKGLDLWGNQLSGEIPEGLGSLTNLRTLNLGKNQLSGEIPEELGSLTNLEVLTLNNNQLSGEIPEELGNLAKLQLLWLGHNQLGGEIPEELGSLTNLEVLGLNSNRLSGEIPEELGSLTNLRSLSFRNNRLTGAIPTELGDLSSLQSLRLQNNRMTGRIPVELGGLSDLEGLYLGYNRLTGTIPAELGSLSDLVVLDLKNNQLTGSIPAELSNLSNLEDLYLASNQLTGCIPRELRDVQNNDFAQLDLPFCATPPPANGDRVFLNGGTLNGQEINKANPSLTVTPGQAISGKLNLTVANDHGAHAVFPVEATPTWGNHQTSYWRLPISPPAFGTARADITINLTAPASPGTYAIIFAAQAELAGGYVSSATHWAAGRPRWNNGDDIAGWSASQIDFAIANGYVRAPQHGWSQPTNHWGAAAVKIVVSAAE